MIAARLGFEPKYTAPEAVVLPLDDLAIIYFCLRNRAFGAVSTIPYLEKVLYPVLEFILNSDARRASEILRGVQEYDENYFEKHNEAGEFKMDSSPTFFEAVNTLQIRGVAWLKWK